MSDKKRINQIAKETGLKNADLVSAAQELGLAVKAHSSSVTDAEAEKIIARVKSGTTATEKTAAPAKDTQSKAKTSKKKDDAPRTFAGKAVVEDPAILARIKAKEEAEKAAKVEAEVKAEPKVEEVKTVKQEKTAPKVEKKSEAPAPAAKKQEEKTTEPVKEEPKKALDKKPRIQIKVVKRAEDIKKEAAKKDAARQERRQNDRRNNDNRRGGQGRNQNDNRRNNDNQNRGGNKFESKPSTEVFTAPATSGKNNNRRDRDRKKNEHDKSSDGRRPGGPLRVNDNRNQVRNARNSNWNQKGRRGGKNQQSAAPVSTRKYHELPESVEYAEGMNVQDIAKAIKREPAEIIKKLFMMGTMVNQNQSLDEDTLE